MVADLRHIIRYSLHERIHALYLVVIGWLYVVVMMAAVSDSILTALARLLFLGILPVVVLLWMGGLRRRRPRPAAEEPGANESPPDRTR